MNKKSIFQIILKTIGLLTLKEGLIVVIGFISLFKYDLAQGFDSLAAFMMSISMLLFYFLIIYFTLFKTDLLISKFKLVDDENEILSDWYFDLNILTSLAVIVIGLSLLINALPYLIREILAYFFSKGMFTNLFTNQSDYVVPLIKVIVGLVFISNHKLINKWINKTSEVPGENRDPE